MKANAKQEILSILTNIIIMAVVDILQGFTRKYYKYGKKKVKCTIEKDLLK